MTSCLKRKSCCFNRMLWSDPNALPNLIAEPDTSADNVADAVNNMLKAIAASLLMEQVLAPNFKFKTRRSDDDFDGGEKIVDIDYTQSQTTVAIKGFAEPSTPRAYREVLSFFLRFWVSV